MQANQFHLPGRLSNSLGRQAMAISPLPLHNLDREQIF
jgi:hypothetical protein